MKKTSRLTYYIFTLFFLNLGNIFAYSFFIGKVTDENGKPIPFAEVYVAENSFGTTTNQDGRFFIKTDGTKTTILKITHSGYLPLEITLSEGNHQNITVVLEEKVYPFDPIYVVGNLYAKESLNIPVVHQTFNIQGFPSSGNSVGDKLDRMGIQMKDYGGAAGLKTTASPTGYGEHILVMVDGLPLNSLQNGTFDFSTLPANLFSQGEYYWGHGSSLYGSNAMGGVINLITDQQFSSFIETKIDEFGERGVSGRSAFTYRNVNGALYGNSYENEGDFRDNNNFSQKSYGVQANLPLGEMWNAHLFSLWNNTDRGISGSLQFPSPLARKTNRDEFHILTLRGLSRFGQTEILFGAVQTNEHYTDPDWTTDSKHEVFSTRLRIIHRFLAKGRIHHNIILDGSANRIKSNDAGKHKNDFESFGWLGQFQLKPNFQITSTIRTEWNGKSDGTITTGSLGFILKPQIRTIKAALLNIGTSYRNPTFNDLYWVDAYGSKGNPNLKPEEGTSTDLAIKLSPFQSDALQLTFRGYHFYTQNLIQWILNPDWNYSPVNLNRTESYGVSLSVDYVPVKFPIQFKFTSDQNESRNLSKRDDRGKRLLYVPAVSHWAEISWRIKSLQVNLNYRFYGRRRFTYSQFYDAVELKSYDRLDFSITYASIEIIGIRPIFSMGVKNLQDRKSQESVYGYPEPGKTIYSRLTIEIP